MVRRRHDQYICRGPVRAAAWDEDGGAPFEAMLPKRRHEGFRLLLAWASIPAATFPMHTDLLTHRLDLLVIFFFFFLVSFVGREILDRPKWQVSGSQADDQWKIQVQGRGAAAPLDHLATGDYR